MEIEIELPDSTMAQVEMLAKLNLLTVEETIATLVKEELAEPWMVDGAPSERIYIDPETGYPAVRISRSNGLQEGLSLDEVKDFLLAEDTAMYFESCGMPGLAKNEPIEPDQCCEMELHPAPSRVAAAQR